MLRQPCFVQAAMIVSRVLVPLIAARGSQARFGGPGAGFQGVESPAQRERFEAQME
eukprot:gene15771-23256_t